MILATHALTGAAVAELFPQHPILGFFAGFVSHFIMDAIPHQDYRLESLVHKRNINAVDMEIGPAFMRDLIKIAFDCAVGFGLIWYLFSHAHASLFAPLWGAIGGVLPDAFQFVYFKFRIGQSLQRFHDRIQESTLLEGHLLISLATQMVLLAAVYYSLFRWKI
jgi:hypothetical protein